MAAAKGSRYILGHLGYTEIAQLECGQETVIVLNPDEPKARFEAAKSLKSAFIRAGKRCVLSSQRILVEVGDGVWKQSCFMSVKSVALTHVDTE